MALVIARKYQESVLIGENIKVTVLKDRRGGVKLSVEAPSKITILREELAKEESYLQKTLHRDNA